MCSVITNGAALKVGLLMCREVVVGSSLAFVPTALLDTQEG
jgi:hypothetical protein